MRASLLLCVVGIFSSLSIARGQSQALTQRIPASANALALWNAERVFVRDPVGHLIEIMSAPPVGPFTD